MQNNNNNNKIHSYNTSPIPINTETIGKTIIIHDLKQASKILKAIKKDVAKIRHEYLNSLADEPDLVENNKFDHYIWRLIVIEQ